MSDVLAEILAEKRAEVARRRRARGLSALEADARAADPPRGFIASLRRAAEAQRHGLICEIKKASPSKGLIRADFDPPAHARAYQEGGATCLSVLTEGPYFQGEDAHLVAARAACALPVLRKDFTLEPYQVAEARALGADCVLLIMAALENSRAAELEATALEYALDVLIEVHDRGELDRALELRSPLVGINNRDLKTLVVDLAVSETLIPRLPADRLAVSESGIYGPDDLDRLWRSGARCFLVGESLMRQHDLAAATAALLAAQGETRSRAGAA